MMENDTKETKDIKGYTQDANQFIEDLKAQGYSKSDIFTKFVTGGKQVVYPVIGEDGRPHLEKKTFKA
jgi:hypothetical protein